MYKGFLVDKSLLGKDVHFGESCGSCHKGNEKGSSREDAHKGLVTKPSRNLGTCNTCHEDITKPFKASLHFTTEGQRQGVSGRFSQKELKTFNEKVFEKSCKSCHASCGDCHIKTPIIGGVNTGLIKGHKFVKKDEGKTCALCHGGRVYPEFTGEYGGTADIHYQKGMICVDCHKKEEMHGSSTAIYKGRKEVKERPRCTNCHQAGQEKTENAQNAHKTHKDKLSCYACHAGGAYRSCYDCHLGKGASAKPSFILGLNPRDKKTVTTLRVIPTVRDTFKSEGIAMEGFDNLPNYWDTTPHNIRKRTERTRSCNVCHDEKKDFLTKELLLKNGSKANESLIYTPKSINK